MLSYGLLTRRGHLTPACILFRTLVRATSQDVDVEEDSLPTEMIEVEFKTKRLGLTRFSVAAGQTVLDVCLLIAGAIEDSGKEAVLQEFDEGADDQVDTDPDRKPSRATTLFILSWENAESAAPLNTRAGMGENLAKQGGPLYVYYHEPADEFSWEGVGGNLTGFYPPAAGHKGFSKRGAEKRARKQATAAVLAATCVPDPNGSGWMARLYRIMSGKKRAKVYDAPPRRLRLKRKVKLMCKATQSTAPEHTIAVQTEFVNPEVGVQVSAAKLTSAVQTVAYETDAELRLKDNIGELQQKLADTEKLRQAAIEAHKPCAGELAQAKRQIVKARAEASVADHAIAHAMVQTDIVRRELPRCSQASAPPPVGSKGSETPDQAMDMADLGHLWAFWTPHSQGDNHASQGAASGREKPRKALQPHSSPTHTQHMPYRQQAPPAEKLGSAARELSVDSRAATFEHVTVGAQIGAGADDVTAKHAAEIARLEAQVVLALPLPLCPRDM